MLVLGTPAATAAVPESLRTTVLALHAEHQQQQPSPTLRLYLGADMDGRWLRRVEIRQQGLPPYLYEFSDVESRALAEGGYYRIDNPIIGAADAPITISVLARTEHPHPASNALVAHYTLAGATGDLSLTLRQGLLGSLSLSPDAQSSSSEQRDARYAAFLDASGRGVEAAALRAGLPPLPAALPPAVARDPVEHYNAAIAALNQGDPLPLAALGSADADSVVALALRDAANLALGYHYLRHRQGDAARQALQQVRSPGPYDRPALLGLGWALLVPAADDAARPSFIGQLSTQWQPGDSEQSPQARRDMPFRRHDAQTGLSARAEPLQQALVIWDKLTGRDPLDPAVQEAALAIPYALDHLGDHAQALQRRQRAITLLEGARAQLRMARAQVNAGQLEQWLVAEAAPQQAGHGWRQWWADLHRDDDRAWTLSLLDNPQIARHLAALREARSLQALVAADLETAAGSEIASRLRALQPALTAAASEAGAALRNAALTTLDDREAQTRRYLAEAHYALARSQEHGDMPLLADAAGDAP